MNPTLTGERLDFDSRDAAAADDVRWGDCEWPTRSPYSEVSMPYRTLGDSSRTCGRHGARSAYGRLFLCWQHRERMFTEVINAMTYGGATVTDYVAIAEALVAQMDRLAKHETDDDDDRVQRVNASLAAMVVRIAEEVPMDGRIREAADRLVERRLAETWGAA